MAMKVEVNEQYFLERSIVTEAGCWEWQRFRGATGYGRVCVQGEQLAHRLSYRFLRNHGEPIVHELDHLCRNRACVNPDHLEDVTHQTNMRRAPFNSYIAALAARTACVNGHDYTPENTRISNGQRYCLTCKRESSRRYRERRHPTLTSESPRPE